MKKIINMHKYIIGTIIGIILLSTISVFAIESVKAVIESSEVTYNNKSSGGRSEDVQGSIDELYERSGVMKENWIDPILNGADPVFDKQGELIPVEIDGNGKVKYANLKTKWYYYEEKKWANAVILTDEGKNKNYKTGDKIDEEYIESYFVWIPRYKYKIWDLGKYNGAYVLENLKDTADFAVNDPNALRHITGNRKLIDIVFETKDVPPSKEEKVRSYYTHPAFITFNVNGLWVGKFETGKNSSGVIIKPNIIPQREGTIGTFFRTSYDYKRSLDSHMMKNTEWGAVAYLSHSAYGIGKEININNASPQTTGYSAEVSTDQSSLIGELGSPTDETKTKAYNTITGYLASTTGNITGIYDMSGGLGEYMAAYVDGYGENISSGLTSNELTTYSKYFDKYPSISDTTLYSNRILGDATGEMGPFYQYYDKNREQNYHNVWYADNSMFVNSTKPWFSRGAYSYYGALAGQFAFCGLQGNVNVDRGFRLVLAF